LRYQSSDTLDLLEHGRVLGHTHAEQFLCSPIFIEDIVRVFSQLLHICANKHLSKLDEITVLFIIHFNNTPRILTSANLATVGGVYKPVRTNDSERNFAGNLLSFSNRLIVLVVIGGCLEDVNVVMSYIRQNLKRVG
jgi:hypothetical protein